jgi:hypothetical protein
MEKLVGEVTGRRDSREHGGAALSSAKELRQPPHPLQDDSDK